MRQRHRVPLPRVFLSLAILGLLVSRPAFPSGFQVMTQGAKATGMGLAFAGVADDPSAIFFNPAGMGFQEHFSPDGRGGLLSRSKADFVGADPFPGEGSSGSIQKQQFIIPNLYAVVPLTPELNFGLGINAPYGLGLRWNEPELWSGRFISQNAVIKTTDINPDLLLQALSRARDRGRRGPALLQGPARAQLEPRHHQPVHGPGRGRRARQAVQRPDVQRRLGLQRRHHVEADPGDRRRRLLPQQDHGEL